MDRAVIAETRVGPVIQFLLLSRILRREVYRTAAYFVDGLLIDTGFQRIAPAFFEAAATKNVEQIAHTHAHEDHVAADYLFQQRLGLVPRAHAKGLTLLQHPPPRLKPYRRFVWGRPRPAEARPLPELLETPRHRLQVIPAPGHSEDHVAFYEANEGWLFGGDLFLSVKVRVLKYDEDFHRWKASLAKILTLPCERYFCGSGKVLSNPRALLGLKLEFFEEVEDRVRRLHSRGWPLSGIRDTVLGREGWLTYISQGEFSKMNLVRSILAGDAEPR